MNHNTHTQAIGVTPYLAFHLAYFESAREGSGSSDPGFTSAVVALFVCIEERVSGFDVLLVSVVGLHQP